MYQQHLLELSRDMSWRAMLLPDEIDVERRNPACGDEVAFSLQMEEDRLSGIRFQAQGCAISLASATALCRAVEGRPLDEARERVRFAQAFFDSERDWTETWGLPDLPALGAVRTHPMRLSCVRLPWEAVASALARGNA